MLNKIILMGRLTHDPELRRTQNGTAVTGFSLAVERDFKDEDGKRATDFIDIVAWRAAAEFVAKYFTKGRMAVVEGRLQIHDWKDKDGNNRHSAEITRDGVNALNTSLSFFLQRFKEPLHSGSFSYIQKFISRKDETHEETYEQTAGLCAGGHHADKLHDRHRSCGRRPCYQHELSAAPALPRHERQCRGGSRLR